MRGIVLAVSLSLCLISIPLPAFAHVKITTILQIISNAVGLVAPLPPNTQQNQQADASQTSTDSPQNVPPDPNTFKGTMQIVASTFAQVIVPPPDPLPQPVYSYGAALPPGKFEEYKATAMDYVNQCEAEGTIPPGMTKEEYYQYVLNRVYGPYTNYQGMHSTDYQTGEDITNTSVQQPSSYSYYSP